MKKKSVRRLLMAMAVATAVANTAPTVSLAAEAEDPKGEGKDEQGKTESKDISDNVTVKETENPDGSTTTKIEYTEEIKADSFAEAVEKAETKKDEQEQIKNEIEAAGGTYDYTIEIKDNSTEENVSDQYDSKKDAEEAAEKVNGTITEEEGTTNTVASAAKDGFESEEAAKEWADEKAKELEESQVSDSSEKVTTEITISKVEGTGTTVEETKDIEKKTFETEEEAKNYAESFNDPNYTITEVNGRWEYTKKVETEVKNDDGEILYFDSQEEADKYIEENSSLEGAYVDTIEVEKKDQYGKKETVVITATSYEEFLEKVNALYAEAEENDDLSILETKEEVLENYKTSINFEELSDEEKEQLMKKMEEDAADQNYTYTHLDLQTSAKMNVYDDNGNATEVDCSIKDDDTLKVRVFTEINGKMTEITMNTYIEKDPQGYWEIRSKSKSLNLQKCFVLIEGTLEYELNGVSKEATFSTTGYLNNDYNTCKMKPGQDSQNSSQNQKQSKQPGRPGWNPGYEDENQKGGYDIILNNFVMNSEGKVTVESSATKVYTITVTKTATKYYIKHQIDDPDSAVKKYDYEVTGTYVEKTEIPAEYMAEITSQLTNILYNVNYTKKNQDFTVIVDGSGQVTVVPEQPEPPVDPVVPNNPTTPNKPSSSHNESSTSTTTVVVAELPVDPQPVEEPIITTPIPESEVIEVPEDNSINIPKTGESNMAETMALGGTIFSGLAATFVTLFRKKEND